MSAERREIPDPRRRDLLNAIAVGISLPSERFDRPLGPGGRSLGSIFALEGYGPGTPEAELAEDFLSSFVQIVDDATQLVPDRIRSDELQASPYAVGPAAGGLPDVIVVVASTVYPYLDNALTLWGIGEALWKCKQGVQLLLQRLNVGYHGGNAPLIFSEPIIRAACFRHLSEHYQPKGPILIESQARSSYLGFAAAEHPAPWLDYFVRADFDGKTYCYSIKATGDFLEHFVIEDGSITLLPLPYPYNETYEREAEVEQLRSIPVEPIGDAPTENP